MIPPIILPIGPCTPVVLWLGSAWLGGTPYSPGEQQLTTTAVATVCTESIAQVGPIALMPADEQPRGIEEPVRAFCAAHPDRATQLTMRQYSAVVDKSSYRFLEVAVVDSVQWGNERRAFYRTHAPLTWAAIYRLDQSNPSRADLYWTNYEPHLPARITRRLHWIMTATEQLQERR